jgi:ADP-ribosylglycohydrolase
MPGWEPIGEILKKELKQLREEGRDIRVEDAFIHLDTTSPEQYEMLIDAYRLAKRRKDFSYDEPDRLDDILKRYKDVLPRTKEPDVSALHGAVLGRMIGCTLGKPLEHGPYFWESTPEHPGWMNVKRWFEGAGQYPIRDYVPSRSDAETSYGLSVGCPRSQKDNLRFVETDDDVRYTLLALEQLERHGFDFTDRDIGNLWHELLPYKDVCTAETQCYLNFAQISSHLGNHEGPFSPKEADFVRMHLNPYREWIGAQIRIDGYAYAAAGDPLTAAKLAHREAHFSHVKNGVYSAMFFAAMIASAFVSSDIDACIAQAFAVIPPSSRLAAYLKRTMKIVKKHEDVETMVAEIWSYLLDFDPAHSINNSCICLASILSSGGDFSKAIGTAALFGLDTDCNAATVGSFMGALLGEKGIPDHWIGRAHV